METEGFKILKDKIHAYLSHDRLKEAISALFQMLAENLNYDVGEGCWFYNNGPKNGKKYGHLYTWEAAKRACPPGLRRETSA